MQNRLKIINKYKKDGKFLTSSCHSQLINNISNNILIYILMIHTENNFKKN